MGAIVRDLQYIHVDGVGDMLDVRRGQMEMYQKYQLGLGDKEDRRPKGPRKRTKRIPDTNMEEQSEGEVEEMEKAYKYKKGGFSN